MTIFCDTSVLVAAVCTGHTHHEAAWRVVNSVLMGINTGYVATHSLAETYSVLTRLPVVPRISPLQAWRMLRENVIGHFRFVSLKEQDYTAVLESLADRSIGGGQTYDALLLHSAEQVAPDRLYTLNANHFVSLSPHLAGKILTP